MASNKDVTEPDHYKQGEVQTWDGIVMLGLGYLEGNVVKYVSRYKHKGDPVGDLKKARQYINKLIELNTPEGEEE